MEDDFKPKTCLVKRKISQPEFDDDEGRNEFKRRAREILNQELLHGTVERPMRCEICGSFSRRIEAHHFDYRFPLDVVWGCPPCHGIMDTLRRRAEERELEELSIQSTV